MNAPVEHERTLVRYLLGKVSEAERAEVEKRLLTEDGFEDELQAALDDVLQGYLKDALAPTDREHLEKQLQAIPHYRQRLTFMKDLLTTAGRVPQELPGDEKPAHAAPTSSSAWRLWAQVAAVLLALLGAILLLARQSAPTPPRSVASLPSPSPEVSPSLPQGSPVASSQPPPSSPAVIRFPAAATAVVEAQAPAPTQALHVVIPVSAARPSFEAVVRTADGREVWRADGLVRSKRDQAVALTIPAGVLIAADYTLALESEAMRDPDAPPQIRLSYRLRLRSTP